MENEYPIMMGSKNVGTARRNRQGLYDKIICNCFFEEKQIRRVILQSGENRYNLGVLIPESGEYCLETSIPAKKIEKEPIRFYIDLKEEDGMFVPIQEGKPFAHLDKLRTARFFMKEGIPGILIEKAAH